MSKIHLLPILLPILSGLAFFGVTQPVAIACQPIARIASDGAARPKGANICAHEKVALNSGKTSVKLTCLTNRKQIDFKGGSAFMACAATTRSAQLMRCPTDKQMMCVEPKGHRKRLYFMQTATHITWTPTPDATHYKIFLEGHGVFWQTELNEPILDYQEIPGLTPGNAYRVRIQPYQKDTQLIGTDLPLNVPPTLTASYQSK